MTTSHTPGPWAIGLDTDDHEAQIISADGWHLATVALDPLPANARLIAAAPDLLAALEAASNYIDALGGDGKSYRQTIARAKVEA